jgi:hypothetical protein
MYIEIISLTLKLINLWDEIYYESMIAHASCYTNVNIDIINGKKYAFLPNRNVIP